MSHEGWVSLLWQRVESLCQRWGGSITVQGPIPKLVILNGEVGLLGASAENCQHLQLCQLAWANGGAPRLKELYPGQIDIYALRKLSQTVVMFVLRPTTNGFLHRARQQESAVFGRTLRPAAGGTVCCLRNELGETRLI
jgi:hypothetical protein